uniref:Uncharacterized protein n=1 Tax=Micrurus spixii TaxID=129469 RepID=A0A2D4ML13_9SAUR
MSHLMTEILVSIVVINQGLPVLLNICHRKHMKMIRLPSQLQYYRNKDPLPISSKRRSRKTPKSTPCTSALLTFQWNFSPPLKILNNTLLTFLKKKTTCS